MLEFLYKPEDGISYQFILLVYVAASLVCLILLLLEHGLQLEAVKGYWIVFAPFLPGSVWAFAMYSKEKEKAITEKKKA